MEKKTTTRCERILAAFSHLKMKGLVKTQQDVPTDGSSTGCCTGGNEK